MPHISLLPQQVVTVKLSTGSYGTKSVLIDQSGIVQRNKVVLNHLVDPARNINGQTTINKMDFGQIQSKILILKTTCIS